MGEKTKEELDQQRETDEKIKKQPMKTRDAWQNRMQTEEYLPVIKEIFENVRVITNEGTKIASKNPELNLENELKQKKKRSIKI